MTANISISEKAKTVTPPFLLLAALVFWGWQSGLLIFGAVMGLILESARFIKVRWDLSTDDFRRLWNFCALLGFALALYVFSTNDEGGGFNNLFHGSNVTGNATLSGIHTTTVLGRWLPLIFFLFVAAQNFSERETIPLSAISMIFRRRQQNAVGVKPEWQVNVAYMYFIVCLFSAGIHANEGTHIYFWGICVLLAWGLWPLRTRRFSFVIWLGALLIAVALAYFGTRGIGQLEQLAQNYNAQWMSRFLRQRTDPEQTMTAIGQIGELKLSSAIAIRLETKNNAPPPTYLREASYRDYHSARQPTWHAGDAREDFADISHAVGDETSWVLLPKKTHLADVQIACYLNGWAQDLNSPEGLLPLPSGSARLENLPAISLKMNHVGAVLAAGPGLLIFNARYGPGQTFDLPAGVRIPSVRGESPGVNSSADLAVPTNELPAIQQVIAEMKISSTNEEQERLAVAQFFASKFTYSTWQRRDKISPTNETALARFLLRTRSGHCEYFATATVLLLRELGIPARYAVGYYVHEANGDNQYVVRERDAHAWCLAWDGATKTWEDFDTTPGSWIATESQGASAMQSIKDFFSWLHFQFSKFRWGQTNLRRYILWAVIPMLAFLLYQIVFRRGRKRRAQKSGNKNLAEIAWPGLDSEFYRLEKRLAARGIPRQPGEALSDWLERALAETSLADLRMPLRELLRLHYRHRFDPNGLDAGERKSLAQKADSVLRKMPDK
jgi:protein-glutamine gamma-glutamyltransferase